MYMLTIVTGSQALQVRFTIALRTSYPCILIIFRMLENPADESVVRWGNEGDSFVVLEVGLRHRHGTNDAENKY